jgi:hypothetical protein
MGVLAHFYLLASEGFVLRMVFSTNIVPLYRRAEAVHHQ